jgi:hypothetical protein
LALIFLILMSSLIVLVTATAISTAEDGSESTALTLEYEYPAVDVNGIVTSRTLTHPDHRLLGTTHTDSFNPREGWRKAWSFYLYGPLEVDYDMRGELKAYLYLYASNVSEVEIRLEILDVDGTGKAKHVDSERFDDVELDDSLPSSPVELSFDLTKSYKFKEGHSILFEIWIKIQGRDRIQDLTVYLAYDSSSAHSRIEFPGIVMPESLLSFMLIAPLLPLMVRKFRRWRKDEKGGIR